MTWPLENEVDIYDTETYNDRFIDCPRCGKSWRKHSISIRRVIMTRGRVMYLSVSRAKCEDCNKFFSNPKLGKLIEGRCRFHPTVVSLSLEAAKRMTLEKAVEYMEKQHQVKVAVSTVHDWVHKRT